MTTMKMLAVLCLFVLGALSAPERDGDLYDMFDAKMILEDDKLRSKAIDCLLDRGVCDDYQPIRDKGPRLIKTRCEDCTPEQKAVFEESMKILEEKFNNDFKEIIAKYA
ncbi:uncharacterized protein LOC115446240 isoform X2 [Manduca sexta]|nr:uncharacterized protein LOC115446240 isoform X2 [Manduca sexta]KAG6454410.1 hypothetical protein O3G_MSEX008700 [Manduca sexta]CAJ01498.1 hypothetical protein [Manduca sexta]